MHFFSDSRCYPHSQILTNEDLLAFAAKVNGGDNFAGKTVELMTDLNLNGMTWTPLASFKGEFDGNGHTISNFHIDASANNARVGFFNIIESGDGERVHDLTLKNITATVGNGRFGTLANSIQGIVNRVTIQNVTVTTTHKDAWVGGLGAFFSWPWVNDCNVENLTVNAQKGAALIGGFTCILQKNSNMVFNNNHVKGFTVRVSDTDGDCGVGGFVVQTQRGWEYPKITNSSVTGIDITASGTVDVGGFIAWLGAHTTLEDCHTQGKIDVTGVTSGYAGGFLGNLGWNCDLGQKGHKIIGCSADVNVTTKTVPAGGFVGSATNANNQSMYADFTSCTSSGNVICISGGNAPVGGFAGVADRGHYTNCSASGNVSGTVAGGFIGKVKDTTVQYDSRYPLGTRKDENGQSLAATDIELNGCTVSGTVMGSQYAGGMIGFVDQEKNGASSSAQDNLTVKNCTVSGVLAVANASAKADMIANLSTHPKNNDLSQTASTNSQVSTLVKPAISNEMLIMDETGLVTLPAGGAYATQPDGSSVKLDASAVIRDGRILRAASASRVPRTGDRGVTLYAVLALLSLLGIAYLSHVQKHVIRH